ncbi:proteasome (prosome, macropain) 26S subunit, non-ATPase, 3, isoform CRA_a [Mus musculus]|nr:proteasome (prosome, macropain) 26S subunit, non-ATPase, 3, isoform CRA_a [Mus musculus]
MKQEGSARRRGADKAKPPPGGEQEPWPSTSASPSVWTSTTCLSRPCAFLPNPTTRTWSLQRSGESGSSRTWSLPRRWRRMTTTASPEPGRGRGGLSGDWLFLFSLRCPLPGKLFSVSHTRLTDCICAGVRDAGSQPSPSCYHASL